MLTFEYCTKTKLHYYVKHPWGSRKMHQTMQGELLYLTEVAFGIVNHCWCSEKP
jgi:hypothetical protein